tara:strand:- start:292 stop:414 length:123 start_codon:yes stop_codon:yes gene_type:complete
MYIKKTLDSATIDKEAITKYLRRDVIYYSSISENIDFSIL